MLHGETEQPPQDDTIPYRDVWSEEQANKALAVYGDDMQEDRMSYSEGLYHRAEATTRFEVYDDVGHSYSDEIVTDIISFHARHNDIDHDSRTIADDPSSENDLEASSCSDVEDHEDNEVSVSFVTHPTVGDQQVKIKTEVASSFGQRARTRLFPETGGGTWGLGLDRIAAGASDEKSYEVDPSALALGEILEVQAFPNDWSWLDDVVASDCAVVSGVQFVNIPQAGDDEITVEYMYPEGLLEDGRVELDIDGDTIGTLETVKPGIITRETYSLTDVAPTPDTTEFAGGETVEVKLCTDSGECIDVSRVDIRPTDVADVDFVDPPVDGENSLTLSYELAENYEVDRFVSLRLYIDGGSSWGIYLDELEPGDNGTSTFQIMPDELGVPFETDRQINISIVDSTDPYGRDPLTTADIVAQSIPSEGRVEGTVTNANGEPSENVEVTVSGGENSDFKTTTLTDATGMYSVEVEAGYTYKIAATEAEFTTDSVEVTVETDKTHLVNFELTQDDSEQITEYADENGVVQIGGVLEATSDYSDGEIGISLMLQVINAYSSDAPVE